MSSFPALQRQRPTGWCLCVEFWKYNDGSGICGDRVGYLSCASSAEAVQLYGRLQEILQDQAVHHAEVYELLRMDGHIDDVILLVP